MSDNHKTTLEKLCRVCSKRIPSGIKSRRYKCSLYRADLLEIFAIDSLLDDPTKHPQFFCHSCKNTIYHTRKAKYEGRHISLTMPDIKEWVEHTDDGCTVCQVSGKVGRPRKLKGAPRGRPLIKSIPSAIKHIEAIAPPTCHSQDLTISSLPDEFTCPICLYVLDRPLQLSCSHLVCADCCVKWLKECESLKCPCCPSDHLSDYQQSVSAPASIVLTAIGSLNVICNNCKQVGYLKDYHTHKSSDCTLCFHESNTIKDILNKPITSPLTPAEEKVRSVLLQRSFNCSDSPTIKVHTQGPSMTVMAVTTPRVPSGQASARTLRRRSKELQLHRNLVSKGDELPQLAAEIQQTSRDKRQALIESIFKDGDVKATLSAEVSLAIKADLQFTWTKVRMLRRWFKELGVQIASERSMRSQAEKFTSKDNLRTVYTPFTVPLNDRHSTVEISNRPMSYLVDVWEKIKEILDMSDNEETGICRLTWHNGCIPEDELWIKVGGDKGGGTFKMNFQVCNVEHPNSPINTVVFCAFEPPDSHVNLRIALDRYRDQINDLPSKTWRGKKIKLFLSGDYEFLCQMFGLSGAAGRHCCLWCLTSKDKLRNPPPDIQLRSTKSICSDHSKFLADGGDLKRAKHFNNCIREPFFKQLSIDQVCPPGLHVTLGIFFRLFSLLENACHQLDMTVATENSFGEGGSSYDHYLIALEKVEKLKTKYDRHVEEFSYLQELLGHLLVVSGEEAAPPDDPEMQALAREAKDAQTELDKVVKEFQQAEQSVAQGFKIYDGPFVKTLETALASFNVKRQAYYSGTFVGNHVHRTLKEENTQLLCDSIRIHAQRYTQAVVQTADTVAKTFQKAFQLFEKCHRVYDSTHFSASQLDTLEKDIRTFLTFYKTQFPDATFPPKFHILEKHTIDWLRKWGVGFGLMGEQGAESIHKYFNSLNDKYKSSYDGVERLHRIMKEHYIHISPNNIELQPKIKRKKLN